MRRLILLRHAKSDWPAGTQDIARPLAKRGRAAAPAMGAYLAAEHLIPDRVLVSPALRARETWELVAPHLPADVAVASEPRIYEAPVDRLLEVVREAPDSARSLMLVGHNPGFEELAARLVGYGDRYAFARLTRKYPTAGLAVIDFDAEHWAGIAPRSGRLDRFITPKSLGHPDD